MLTCLQSATIRKKISSRKKNDNPSVPSYSNTTSPRSIPSTRCSSSQRRYLYWRRNSGDPSARSSDENPNGWSSEKATEYAPSTVSGIGTCFIDSRNSRPIKRVDRVGFGSGHK
ncbi:hypothetical protein EUGRSUZ_K00720 [Eucalyptus grandis]|uniref:Uncharacterized protein n=2 Tax=Eucalyptus grandis TaxID=71139 RepID=A0ACC3ISL8_EUCGR|nr:hypothetical protein EUGRSUZ_K00720 [Eucalyptus grandis]